ncbi:MAG TPA: aldehyde dehydrogenase [Rudaea sp.]|jgi:aminomuconate-semialdehyde/2-hydroxymuconate-6-semialdehyde dehydrogenase|uniref:aldehyde dehydrogenase n=1 Tax=Rudaea sp. TaxID=2136325 RepID=UPI002F92323F
MTSAAILTLANYIDGALQPPRAGRYLDVHEPAIGAVYARCPDSSAEDIDAAVGAAQRAFPAWAALPAGQRARLLERIAERIETQLEAFAQAESRDSGKPLALARSLDIPRAIANLRFFAAAITQFASETHAGADALNYTLRAPLGVVGCISPWNLPLYLFTWKIAPALAAGNCVVAKPSEITPLTAWMLAQACIDAGLPPGVLNIVHGTGARAGQALIEHPGIAAISFTGSTRTGAAIASTLAPKFKKLSLEMGGKNATLVFADWEANAANLDTIVRSAFANQGQICLCGSRILIERSIYEKFKTDFVEKVRALKVGDPQDAASDLGAIVSRAHFDKVMGHIALAREEGGRVLYGGGAVRVDGRCSDGWFIAPTVIEGLAMDCHTNQEEIFGPVVTLIPFDSDDEAVMLANATRYGLAASLWTGSLTRAHRVAARLESGIVWINCWLRRDLRTPFGGVKDSGVGREGGVEALRFFTEAKNICVAL